MHGLGANRRRGGPRPVEPALLRQRFGAVLRRCRCEAGLSTDVLGERCGLHRDEICKLEKAHREPKLSTIVRLARGLRVPPGYLLAEVDRADGEGR
ncbi:MAG: helix-turn-helix domain-containing protein [Solirubrobacterales bacterium]